MLRFLCCGISTRKDQKIQARINVKEEYNSVANEEIYQQLINEVETAKRTNSTWQLDKELIIIKKID